MNTAMQGAHNLGWKLAWVARGWAGPELLDSYELERRAPGEYRARRSLQMGGPPEIVRRADLVVDGVRGFAEVLALLAKA